MAHRLKWPTGDWIDKLIVASLTASIGILLIGLFSWQLPFGSQMQLRAGEVAPHDVVAPRQITYESQLLTERARERAAQSVPDQYDSPDGRVRRQQVERAREILNFMTIVRDDEFASPELQTDYLLAIPDLDLTPELVMQILSATPDEWEAVVAETPLALDRIMREEIRESNITLIRRRVPVQIATDLSERSAAIT